MATVNSLTFQGNKDDIFATALEIINGAGYPISETDDGAKKFIYSAKSGLIPFVGKITCEVTVSVTGAVRGQISSTENALETSMLSIKTTAYNNVHKQTNNANFENELINFLLTEVKKHYKVIQTKTSNVSNAPGTGNSGGCLVLIGTLGLIAGSCLCCCLMLLNTLFQ